MGMGHMGMNPVAGGAAAGGRNFSNDLYADYNGPEGGEGMAVDQVTPSGLEPIPAEPNQQILVRNVSTCLILIAFTCLSLFYSSPGQHPMKISLNYLRPSAPLPLPRSSTLVAKVRAKVLFNSRRQRMRRMHLRSSWDGLMVVVLWVSSAHASAQNFCELMLERNRCAIQPQVARVLCFGYQGPPGVSGDQVA